MTVVYGLPSGITYNRLAMWQKIRTFPSINLFHIYSNEGHTKNFSNSNSDWENMMKFVTVTKY